MAIPDEIAADIATLETEIPVSFSWNGSDYPCVTGSPRTSRSLQPGGFGMGADLVIFVRIELFGNALPEPKHRVQFDSKNYRIEDVITVAGESFLRLVCVDANQSL